MDETAKVEIHRADLRVTDGLADALAGADTVIHLAAAMGGSEQEHFSTTVQGTERLVDGDARSQRFGTWCWPAASPCTTGPASQARWTKTAPLERHPEQRDAYTLAKLLQERILRRAEPARGLETHHPEARMGVGSTQ